MGGLCSDHNRDQLKAFPPALSFDDTEESEKQVSTSNGKLNQLRSGGSNSNVVSNKLQPRCPHVKSEPVLLVKRLSLVGKRTSAMDFLSIVKSKSAPTYGKQLPSQSSIREAQKDEDKKSSTPAGSKTPTFALKPPKLELKNKRNDNVQPSKKPSTPIKLKSTQCYRNTLFEIMNRDNSPSPKSPDSLDIPTVYTKHRRNTYSGPTRAVKRKRKMTLGLDDGRGANSETYEKQQSERRTKIQHASSEELPEMQMQRSLRKRISAISDNDQDTLRLSTRF